MDMLSRRGFTQQALSSLVAYSLLDTLFQHDAFADEIKPVTLKWLQEVNQLAADMKGRKLKQTEWQAQIEELFKKVDLPDLLKLIDFDKLTENPQLVDKGARSLRLKFPKIEGVPQNLAFGGQIFGMKKDRSVVPHGHNNMTSAFLILKGEFRGRHFDRLHDEKEHLIIKPTIDRTFTPGGVSSISDEKDNIHWFQALTEGSYIFNLHILGVRPNNTTSTGRIYVDPNGEKLADGTIRAKLVDYATVNKLYG